LVLQAYWKASSKRFIDVAVQVVDSGLLRRVQEESVSRIYRMAETSEGFQDLFDEDHVTKEKRKRLEARMQRLQLAHEQLLSASDTPQY
jgi:hypothetical protein